MFPSYGASAFSTSSSVLNVFSKGSSPVPTSKPERDVRKEMAILPNKNASIPRVLSRSRDKGVSLPASQLSSSGAASHGQGIFDCEDADMVLVRSSKQSEPDLLRKTSDGIFNGSDIKEILKADQGDDQAPHTTSLLVNGSSSPKRHSRSSRESSGSTCSESHLELSKSICSSPLPKLFESLSPAERASMTRPQIVAQEIVVTERIYVRDLQEVIEGYLFHLLHHGMTELDVETIFGNLEEIFDFNRGILEDLEEFGQDRDPVRISQCFLNKAHGFNSLYVQYCTNYPESAAFLTEILKDKEISDFFAERQKASGHTLPIDSYLMKPVQRIMKYHLLFKDMAKHFGSDEDGYEIIQKAAGTMTDVAEYINEVKRLHENALRVQEILGSIEDLEGLDVFTTGRLVLENSFRVHGSRGDKQLYLFEKLLLICKKLDEGIYQFRDGLSCSNMMLVESIPKEPLCFQLIRFDNQKVSYTIQAKTADIKRDWTMQLKRLILETHTTLVPTTAKEAILGRSENVRESKYSSINLQALDDTKIHWRRQKSSSQLGKENHQKDRGSLLVGVKRDSVLKEDSNNVPKRSSLNTKAKEFLDKQTKEKIRNWKLKRQKPRKNSRGDSFDVDIPDRKVMSPASEIVPPSTIVKSRSLESLRDAINGSQEDILGATNHSQQNEQSNEANNHIQRLSILHDLVSLDSLDGLAENETEMESPRTPTNIRELRRRHASKSVYLEQGDDPIKPGDLKRTRPLSLPPGATIDEAGIGNTFFDADNDSERISNDLRKYGLTRTRSFNRKNRGGIGVLSGSASSVTGPSSTEKRAPTNVENGSDKFEMLEKRLSIISDDENTSNCIKNTLRKVSQAFSSYASDHALDSQHVPSTSTASLTADIDAFLAQEEIWKSSTLPRAKRRSLGSIISETINPTIGNSLDSSKKRAFSTSVINEVSIEIKDEDLEKRLSHLDNEIDRGATYIDTMSRLDGKTWDRPVPMPGAGIDRSFNSEISGVSFDSQMSTEGIDFTARKETTPMDTVETSRSDASQRLDPRANEPNDLEPSQNESQFLDGEQTAAECSKADEEEENAPMRPAAPSSLNYVRSYAASIRRYRKKNDEIGESKSVYDRIREYTALVSKEKSEQQGKSVDEMIESLDTANTPVTTKYIDNRRKFTRMASVVGERKSAETILSAPHVWFDTKPVQAVRSKEKGSSKTSRKRAEKDLPRAKAGKARDNKSAENNESVDTQPPSGITAVLNGWRNKESSTLPRCKVKKGQSTRVKNGKSALHPSDTSKDDWKKNKSHTIAEASVSQSSEAVNATINCEKPQKSRGDNARVPESDLDEDGEPAIPVKDLVKQYYQQVIVPGEKEVEDMIESKMRRSKKKKEREKMKSSLQRKLSLRNLATEEEEEKKGKNKLNRSVSYESVQRGTVKQLISLFNVSKQ